jgi:hypothetical protein
MFTPINFRSSIKNHTTNDELIFIQAMGKYHVEAMKLDRVTLLTRYIGSLKYRSDWNKMDKNKIIAFATKELSNEMSKKGSLYAYS